VAAQTRQPPGSQLIAPSRRPIAGDSPTANHRPTSIDRGEHMSNVEHTAQPAATPKAKFLATLRSALGSEDAAAPSPCLYENAGAASSMSPESSRSALNSASHVAIVVGRTRKNANLRHVRRTTMVAIAACGLLMIAAVGGASSAFAATLPEVVVMPTISPTTPHLGRAESGTTGSWRNGPTSLGYQWRRCNATGGECANISGATGVSYTPVEADLEHTLALTVSATNSEGANSAQSQTTSQLKPVGTVTTYAITNTSGIATGSDGNLWITGESGTIRKVTAAGAVVATYHTASEFGTTGITAGPGADLWFTQAGVDKVSSITTSGAITEYSVSAGSEPFEITTGADKNLWFTDKASSKIGKITTTGTVTEYALPAGSQPYGIAAGPGENLWFADKGTSKIGKITTTGTITEYPLPAGSKPNGISAGPEETVWFAENGTGKIGKATATGAITEYALTAGSQPAAIVAGPDNYMWFVNRATTEGARHVGRISTSGAVTEYALSFVFAPTLGGITIGPDGNAWFTDGAKLAQATT
jgi:streptogramin lyase